MSKKFLIFAFLIATFLLSCRTLQEGVIVAVVTHNLHGTINPSLYTGDFDDYPEPSKKEVKKKEPKPKKESPSSGPRYRIKLTEAGYVLVISKPIVFANNEMTMNRKYEDSIDIVLEFLDDYTNAKLIVEGHPDKLSDISYGYMLSRVRASSICDELIDNDIDDNRLLFYQNNTRIDNASVSMDNESIKFVIINDKTAYAHYLSYLRNYSSKYPDILLVKETLPTDLKKPQSDSPSLVLKSGDGTVISKTPTKKVTPKEEPKPRSTTIEKEPPSKKEPKKNVLVKKEEVIAKDKPSQHTVKRVGILNLLETSEPITFNESSYGIPVRYTNSIKEIISFMNANTNVRIVVEGYSDKTINDNDNIKLSENRGSSVYKALSRSGIERNRLLLHGSSGDINNTNVLIENNNMRFIVIRNSYDYYNYVKYLRNYNRPTTPAPIAVDKKTPVESKPMTDRRQTRTRDINPLNNTDIFDLNDSSKKVIAKEEVKKTKKITKKKAETKKIANKENTKETIVEKEPAPKKVAVKKEPAPKQVKAKKKATPKKEPVKKEELIANEQLPQYIVERVGTLNILQPSEPIIFNKSSYSIPLRHTNSINDIIRFMNANTNVRIVVEGYSDKTDNSSNNIKLSENRGSNVYKALLRSGIDQNRLLLHGSSGDINNTNVLIENNNMRFIVIKNSYDYYNYIKYLRDYRPAVSTSTTIVVDKKPMVDRKLPMTRDINPLNNTDIFENNSSKKVVTKEEPKQAKNYPKKKTATKVDKAKKTTPKKEPDTKEKTPELKEKPLPQYKIENLGNLKVVSPESPIEFNSGSSLIETKSTNSIKDIIDFLNDNIKAKIAIEGYSDKTDNLNNNIKLSEDRGNSVYRALIRSGIEPNRLLLHGNDNDINNTTVLVENNGMHFVIINNSYDYYNYIKYLRNYKSAVSIADSTTIPVAMDEKAPASRILNPNNNPDIFNVNNKRVKTKKQSAPKQVKAKQEPAPKQAKAKQEPAPKQAKAKQKATTKTKKGPKMEYRVLQASSLYILLEQDPIMFKKSSSALDEKSSKKSIDYIVNFLNASTNSRLVVEGYSDKTGTSNQYVAISKARGYSVYKKLIDRGIEENRLLLYGSGNDLNNAHVLLDNDGMRFIIIKDSYAYYNYVNYIRKYVPKAKPTTSPPPSIDIKTPAVIATKNRNIIPLNDTNASISIVTEEQYKKELALANSQTKVTKDKKDPAPKQAKAKKETPVKQAKAKKETPVKQAKAKKETPVKQAKAKKETPVKQAKAKKETPVKQAKAKKETPVKQAKAKKETPVKQAKAKKETPAKQAKAKAKNAPSSKNKEIKVTVISNEYKIELSNGLQVLLPPDSIAFDYQSAIVDTRYKSSVKHIADFLKENPQTKMVIEGNSYESGTDSYNTILSRARATAIYNELLKGGIDRDRLLLHSVGNKIMAVNGNSPKKNRVIRFVIIKNQGDYSRYLDFLKRSGI